MSRLSNAEIASSLNDSYRCNEKFSESLAGILTLDEAYKVQFDLAALRQADGEKLAGWKVGLTSKAMQEQQGVHEPCLGYLLQSGQVISPAQFQFDDMIFPGFENELCLRLKSSLSGAGVSFDEALAAIGEVAPALEIIERRSDIRGGLALVIAGNAQQKNYVTGPFVPIASIADLSNVEASVEVNGIVQERATGDKVLGHPVNSLIWLAAKLSEFDCRLDAGAVVMSGSFTKQYLLNKGDKVRTSFEGVGVVEAAFR
jgi:2-keto-4-pentenoate hydratase